MTHEEFLRHAFVGIEVDGAFAEAVLTLRDGSRLAFCHRVGERWAKAAATEGDGRPCLAARVLDGMALFRLNGKHLDVRFTDGSRWEVPFRVAARPPHDPADENKA
jgi:hypothetical protein